MKLTVRYDNRLQEINLSQEETEGLWVSLSLEGDGLSQEEKERLIQEKWEEEFNKPEYNNWHQHNRHSGNAVMKSRDGSVEVNTDEAILRRSVDPSGFTKSLDAVDNQANCEDWCREIRRAMKPKQAEMIIAIALNGMTVGEYAASIGETDGNKISHRYRRAVKKFREIFPKSSF